MLLRKAGGTELREPGLHTLHSKLPGLHTLYRRIPYKGKSLTRGENSSSCPMPFVCLRSAEVDPKSPPPQSAGTTPNPPTNIVGLRGFDSSTMLFLRGEIPRPIGIS